MITSLDKDRIEAAVAKAEAGTTGEVVCVLAAEVSHYPEIPLAWGAAVALAAPPIALAFGLRPLAVAGEAGVWLVAQASALEAELALTLLLYTLAQVVLFVAVALLVSLPAVRRALTPRALKRHRVQRAAQHHFSALAARAGASQTGVLLFVAMDDHQVEVLADAAFHQKAGEALWTRAAGAIGMAMKGGRDPTAGIIEAVEMCGAALRQYFPGEHAGSFSDRPVEI